MVWGDSASTYVVVVQVVGGGFGVETGKMLSEMVAVGIVGKAHCDVVADSMVE